MNEPTDGEGEANASTELVPAQQGSEVIEGGNDGEAGQGDENDVTEVNPEGPGPVQPEGGASGTFSAGGGFTPGFDQMQMMMAMQNGFVNFPIMGALLYVILCS